MTERPACFEIDPRGVRSSAPIGYGCRTQLITAYNCGSISSSRCQIARVPGARSPRGDAKIRSKRTSMVPGWWSQTGSNRRPPACKAGALPTELWPLQGTGSRYQQSRRRRQPSDHRLLISEPRNWWAWDDSNVRPHPYQGCALTT